MAPTGKHVQFGFDPKSAPPAGERPALTKTQQDEVWADACTVDEYKAALEALSTEPPEVIDELRRARETR